MKKLVQIFALMLFVIQSSLSYGQNTVMDIIANSADHTTLEAALIAAELNDDLSGAGPFTVFAPTDDAFAALPAGAVDALLLDPTGELAQILLYHVTGASVTSAGLTNGATFTTLQGKDVEITVDGSDVYVNDALITVKDIHGDNGAVHVINTVLSIPYNVVEIIVNSPDHETLEAAVIAAELDDDLSGAGPFTVFAPTDDAFAALPAGVLDDLLADPTGDLAQILLYHVANVNAKSTGLSNGQMVTTLQGKDVEVTIDGSDVFINDAQVTVADIEATNGVVHVINAVLSIPNTVVDVIVNSPDHETLEAAVIAADLAGALSAEGPFTVFAPTDAAFEALPDGALDALLADPSGDLTDILTYHVVSGKALSGDLIDGQYIPTLNGDSVKVNIEGENVYINDAMVTGADIMADNGVVHVIDKVLMPYPATVVEIVVNSPDHETLEAAVIAADLAGALSAEGPFTVFAPTDAAFAALPAGALDALLADPSGDLTDILTYHVVSGKALSGDLSDGQYIPTLNGDSVKVNIEGENVYINDAMVTGADIMADNGVVHVIDKVLMPYPATVVEIVVNSPDHETLEAAVIAADLAGALSAEGPFTVFAPTDAAFAALPDGALDALLADPSGDLTDILTYHVVSGKALSGDLSDGQYIPTLNGDSLKVKIEGENVYINDAMVTAADIMADNGVVHVIDKVLMPYPATVVEIVVNSPDHETLEAAVIAAELADDLSGDGPFTVFAPTDAAFAALPAGALDALLADPTGDLAQILLYHVAGVKALSTDLSDGQMVATLQGKNVEVTIDGSNVFINDAQVTVADLKADNGVVHVIDAVLSIPPTVAEIVINSADHDTLEIALGAAGLVETLNGEGPFTVFAPTDAAFAALPEGLLDNLLADPSGFLSEILLYHVVGGEAFSTDLSDGMMIETLLGQEVEVTIDGSNVFINGAQVTAADLDAYNGVVHVIDAVLVPEYDVMIEENATFGNILTDKDGNSLYFFTKDANDTSVCVDGCLDNWPAFYAGSLYLPEGLSADDFGSFERPDGSWQTTYKGWPLYYFANDMNPGDVNGDSVNGVWFVAKPDYTIMLADNQLVGADGKNYKGDYTEGDEIVQYFTDDMGYTLYTWVNDNFDMNNFTAEDFSNNGVWPVYEESNIVVPSSLDSSDFGVIDVFGKNQLTYKGWPLYYFGQDNMMRGSNKGVSVPAPGVWPVAVADMMEAPEYTTVVDIVVGSEDHETLEAAVIAADLAGTLSGDGPFTVFAPTDDAFAALPDGTLDALLADPSGDLTDILLYHVAGSKAMSGDLSDGQMITTLFGEDVTVTIDGSDVFINDAKVIVADIEADNGVVHVIDAVLTIPAEPMTVVDVIVNSPDHETLEAAVIAADLAGTLSGDGPFTVFAPTDDAFAALPEGTLDALLADPSGDLTDILLYHVVGSKAMSTDLSDGMSITTLFGEDVTVTIDGSDVMINNAMVTVVDIEADNGVVHVIDAVLLPPTSIFSNYAENSMFEIYPNPATDYVLFNVLDSDIQNGTIRIVNIAGTQVSDFSVNNSLERIDLRSFESGVYFIMYNDGRKSITEKLIVR